MTELGHHLSYLAQIFILSVFWMGRLKRKPNFVWRMTACVFALCGSVVLTSYLQPQSNGCSWIVFSYPYFLILVLFGAALSICFDAPPGVILLTLLLPSTAQLCASAMGDVVYYLMGWTRDQFYMRDIVSVAVMCAASVALVKLYDKLYFYDAGTYKVIIISSCCVVLCVFALNGFSPEITDRFTRYVIVAGYRFLMSAFVFFLIFSLLAVGRMRYQKSLTEVLMKKQEQQYALARELTELVSMKYHDIKHMEKSGLTREFLEQDGKRLALFDCVVNCGNSALNTVLTEKSIACKNSGINFTMMVDGALLGFMLPVDIYALFGNALDNAINCLVELPVEERQLRLRVASVGSMVSIACENVCHDRLKFENGLPQTKQTDTYNHGFGTKSIAGICKKYHAEFRISCDGELFTLKILIPAAERGPGK